MNDLIRISWEAPYRAALSLVLAPDGPESVLLTSSPDDADALWSSRMTE